MTKSVFHLTEDADGKLVCELKSTENLNLPDYEPDRELEEKIRPYAELALEKMDQPVGRLTGERVLIDGFSNGRPFDPDRTYLVTVVNYILGNNDCGLRKWSEDDALWFQDANDGGSCIQDSIQEYIAEQTDRFGGVTADRMNWEWSVTFSEDSSSLPSGDIPVAATLAEIPRDGGRYVLYHEAQGSALAADSLRTRVLSEICRSGE